MPIRNIALVSNLQDLHCHLQSSLRWKLDHLYSSPNVLFRDLLFWSWHVWFIHKLQGTGKADTIVASWRKLMFRGLCRPFRGVQIQPMRPCGVEALPTRPYIRRYFPLKTYAIIIISLYVKVAGKHSTTHKPLSQRAEGKLHYIF